MKNIIIAFGLLLIFGCKSKVTNNHQQMITLSNGTVKIKVLSDVGGTMVYASLAGYGNILNSDSSQWNESPDERPSMDPSEPFKAYNGMTVWLSPQSEWWVKQDQYPELRENKSQWPPDPYLTCSAYKIITDKKDEITIESPKSPNTHIQLIKNFRLDGNNIYITAIARNFSDDTISWGLWFNTRMNGWDKVIDVFFAEPFGPSWNGEAGLLRDAGLPCFRALPLRDAGQGRGSRGHSGENGNVPVDARIRIRGSVIRPAGLEGAGGLQRHSLYRGER
jgi:hypothetical protein